MCRHVNIIIIFIQDGSCQRAGCLLQACPPQCYCQLPQQCAVNTIVNTVNTIVNTVNTVNTVLSSVRWMAREGLPIGAHHIFLPATLMLLRRPAIPNIKVGWTKHPDNRETGYNNVLSWRGTSSKSVCIIPNSSLVLWNMVFQARRRRMTAGGAGLAYLWLK